MRCCIRLFLQHESLAYHVSRLRLQNSSPSLVLNNQGCNDANVGSLRRQCSGFPFLVVDSASAQLSLLVDRRSVALHMEFFVLIRYFGRFMCIAFCNSSGVCRHIPFLRHNYIVFRILCSCRACCSRRAYTRLSRSLEYQFQLIIADSAATNM